MRITLPKNVISSLVCGAMIAELWAGALSARAAEPASQAASQPLSSIIPKENPYHPGETIAIHKNLSDKEWPQLANTPQRTNYSPMKFDPPQGKRKWSVCLADLNIDDRIAPPVQPIIGDGRVYVGCKSGKLYALDAKTGEVKWTFQAGGPICHTAGYAKGKVMVAALDGGVYAVNAATGKQEWVFSNRDPNRRRHGFSTAVLLAEDKVFAVDRGGRLFALNPVNGKELWHYDAGAPVDQSPAYDAGKVFFASEDMRVHAVRVSDGTGLWKSAQLAGLSFRWFHPVVVGGQVIVRSLSSSVFLHINNTIQYTDPAKRSLFALDEETGQENIVLKQQAMGHDGTQPPPAVTRDGLLVVQYYARYRPGEKKGGWADPAWAIEDLKTQEVLMPLLEPEIRPPNQGLGRKAPWYAGLWGCNENAITSVIGDTVMTVHPLGFYWVGVYLGGAYDLVNRRWYVDVGGYQSRTDPKGENGWVSWGGDGNEDGGSDAMSAADGLLYHSAIRNHRITCYEPRLTPPTEKKEKP